MKQTLKEEEDLKQKGQAKKNPSSFLYTCEH